MRSIIIVTVFALTALTPASAGVEASQTVQKVAVTQLENGETVENLIAAEKVAPGETVVYTLNYVNSPDTTSENVVLVMPVPDQDCYVRGSINGESLMTRGRLTTREGDEVRVATSDEITHIRWTLESLEPAATGAVSYRGILK